MRWGTRLSEKGRIDLLHSALTSYSSPTLRKIGEGWGTLLLYTPPFLLESILNIVIVGRGFSRDIKRG